MKKKNIFFAILIMLAVFFSICAKADIIITEAVLGVGTPPSNGPGLAGSLTDAGDGLVSFRLPNFGSGDFDIFQQTTFMGNNGSWSGASSQGAFDYDAEIAAMAEGQVAVGLFFTAIGFGEAEIAVLEIFDCIVEICTGNGVPMKNGPFLGSVLNLSGTGSATVVPVPAAVWLMGSGMFVLVSVARTRKQH